ncbi:fungal Zn binuclear cluster domain-containing protein [Penicillium waksmanii]|uniref:fungal Zn binuclear cluster domain-containing protein n=1 Tax=Penicillium waksmanii TaxID=69791 RepID=UPI0025486B2B|nr:fungal Zn binuclear cluster domain-containing protein [Penicillium waksmanii]KAJ5980244.1 fungal Zn binuclear cluster domain-containing protein [Penicillium waksmanii]
MANSGQASRLDMAPNVAPHTTASGYLLTQRQSHLGTRSMAPAVFDRICIESFIYHASIMMLFEPSLDALSSIRRQLDIPGYFSYVEKRDISLPVQPILQTSYDFFLSIADATKLARISRSLVDAEITLWCHTWLRLLQWDQVDHTDDVSLKLYFNALQMLLLKTAPDLSNEEKALQISESLQHGLQIIVSLEPEEYAPSYLLWPLAILGSMSIFEKEKNAVEDFINLLIQSKRGGQAVWVLKRLNRVWNVTKFRAICPSSAMRLQGLQILLDAT